MEHIVQFAIGIDDDGIRKRVEERAEKQIVENIEQQVRDQLFESYYCIGHADKNSPLSDCSKRLIENFLEKHKDEMLEKAAAYLAEKLARSKAGKALLDGNAERV